MQQILLVLRFCATGCTLQAVGDFTGIHKSTACRIVKSVISIFASLAAEYIHMPNTQEEIAEVKRKFHTIAKFPRVTGAIDCTHVKIISPGGANAEYFRNRKGYFSINVQVVFDPNLLIKNIVARWPGSTHVQTILNNSSIKAQFENNRFGNSVMLGYALKKYLITPIINPTTEVEQVFNESQIKSRNPVERSFGVLKRRFPVLSLGIRLSLETAQTLIVACAVLHNIAVNMNEPEPLQDDDQNREWEEEENVDGNDVHRLEHNFREEFLIYFMNLLEENQ
ncbi:unnamed protein product [Acanthoscelides obtectus]|nr:unnamed protein product [Acanthoscelides obtectus]CAK1680493.1 Putative nuclease HARBI1 [Acanthoscelides obtectus]